MKSIIEKTCIYSVTYGLTYCSCYYVIQIRNELFNDILEYINSQKYLQSRYVDLKMDIVLV